MATFENPGKSITVKWFLEHKDYPHRDYCLIWPFVRISDGYGGASLDGRTVRAHRVMCEMIHGPAPSERHHAAHSCNRGRDGCVNPHHLTWKTPEENEADKPPRLSKRKLTIEQAHAIRAAKGLERPLDTARRFGTSFSNVVAIQEGRTWREDCRYMPDDDIRAIRRSTEPVSVLAKKYGVSDAAIYRIRKRKAYRTVPDDQPVA